MGKNTKPEVVIDVCNNPLIAEMVATSLMKRGIPAFVSGGSLQDLYAVLHRTLGNVGVQVTVPKEYEEEARGVLEDLRASGETPGDEETPANDTTARDEHVDEQDLETIV